MDNDKARAVFPTQLLVLSNEALTHMTGKEHPANAVGVTITVCANGEPWRGFKDYSEAQSFLAGAISGARLLNDTMAGRPCDAARQRG